MSTLPGSAVPQALKSRRHHNPPSTSPVVIGGQQVKHQLGGAQGHQRILGVWGECEYVWACLRTAGRTPAWQRPGTPAHPGSVGGSVNMCGNVWDPSP